MSLESILGELVVAINANTEALRNSSKSPVASSEAPSPKRGRPAKSETPAAAPVAESPTPVETPAPAPVVEAPAAPAPAPAPVAPEITQAMIIAEANLLMELNNKDTAPLVELAARYKTKRIREAAVSDYPALYADLKALVNSARAANTV